MTISQGTQFGPYQVMEQIGSGGMGDVYRAVDTRLGREVAIKLVSDRYLAEAFGSGSPTPGSGTPATAGTLSHRRFLREAQSASVLNHAHICTIHDIGEQDGRPYLVMELLRGETLKEALRQGPLSVSDLVTFSQQAASALAAAHAQGIVHRDIKPANIFVLGPEGKRQIKILDFGLAKRQGAGDMQNSGEATAAFGGQATSAETGMLSQKGPRNEDLTAPESTLGTVAYMSPEQARGSALDARTDLFSLGTVMYEMATGTTPFRGGSTADIFAALLTKEPPPVSRVNPAMPRKLDPIIQKLMAKDKTARYASADELQKDLDGLTAPAKASRTPLMAAGVVLLLLLAGLGWWKLKPATSQKGGPATATGQAAAGATAPKQLKDSIILANFVNQTGDPVFDTTLNQALRIDLEQSPVINIVSQEHLRQSVKYLGKPEDTVVTPAIAREIGEREGMKAILTGTIGSLGKQYVITLTAQNTATGDEIASEQATAPDKENVLSALGTAAAAMRAKLGEDLASIKKLNTPFGQATTPSLEAFRAYALGDEAHAKALDIPEAEGHYKRAIELDPNFAMAYARLGVVYEDSGQVAKAKQYYSKAYELSAHVSESERLYISGHYDSTVTGNMPRMIETLQEAIQTYPGQVSAYVNINAAYQALGQFEKGLPYAQKAVELQPENAIAAENLLSGLVALGRMNEAKQELARQHKLGMDSSTDVASAHLMAYFLLGDSQQVQRVVAEMAGHPDEFVITQNLAQTQQYSGQYRKASATFQHAIEQAGHSKAPDAQAANLLLDALGRGLAGLCDGNEATVERALGLDKSKQTQEVAVLAAAVCGNGKLALPMFEDLSRKYPEDTVIQDVYGPLAKAFVALAAGQPQQAVADAEPAKPYSEAYPAAYLQGLAYLQMHDAGNAVNAFKTATKYRASMLVGGLGYYAQAQLGLARAYAMAGDKADAKKAYEALFEVWKNADADLPLLVAAKKEYAGL
jgi:serine/threonine protein kinase/tetratricopeptide (TPR) repeat protein